MACLAGALGGGAPEVLASGRSIGKVTALFSGEWRRDVSSPWLTLSQSDRPFEVPELIALAEAQSPGPEPRVGPIAPQGGAQLGTERTAGSGSSALPSAPGRLAAIYISDPRRSRQRGARVGLAPADETNTSARLSGGPRIAGDLKLREAADGSPIFGVCAGSAPKAGVGHGACPRTRSNGSGQTRSAPFWPQDRRQSRRQHRRLMDLTGAGGGSPL
jgi:hypothetical protein